MTRNFGLTQINAENLSRRQPIHDGGHRCLASTAGSPDADTTRVIPNLFHLAAVKPTSGEHMEGAATSARQRRINSVPTVLGVSSLRSVNSGGEIRQPFIHAGELGSYFLLFIIPTLAALIVLIGALVYLALIA